MIALTSATSRPSSASLEAPGGFAWWYIDLLDAEGNGAVFIVSWGLPFLPGYVESARRGQAPPATERPSLNVVLYKDFTESFYLLQEYAPGEATVEADGAIQMGGSTLRSRVIDGRVEVHLELDCAVPSHAARLSGSVRLSGALAQHLPAHAGGPHVWTPIAPSARGRASLRLGATRWEIEGSAYHDRNSAEVPITALGCRRWTWARVSTGEATWIAYHLEGEAGVEPRTLLMRCDNAGAVEQLDVTAVDAAGWRRQFFGMQLPTRWHVAAGERSIDLRVGVPVDRGPFYTRAPVRAETPDGAAHGWIEVVEPARIDLDLHRPLVQMAVHHTHKPNSMWLPLFSGPREGRVGRLFSPTPAQLEVR